jgi:hypothetical protein
VKFALKRTLAAGAVALAAIVTPLSLTVALSDLGSTPSSWAATGTPASPDVIIYGQGSGNPASFYQYVPGNGSTATTQTVSPSGSCSAPSVSDPNGPILAISAKVYSNKPNSDFYTNKSSAGTVGTSGSVTGVCGIPPSWTIDNKSNKGAEALDFSPGSDTAVIGPNRQFIDAQIPIQRKDSGVAQPGATVRLVEFDSSGNQLAFQTCTISGGEGTQITADTDGPGTGGNCTGTPPPAFETVEVQNTTTSTSISVVGPAATFTLGSEICGGQTITSTGPVSAKLTLTGVSTSCKAYTTFSSGPNATGQEQLDFNGFSAGAVPFTVNITWPAEPLCQPYPDTNHPDESSAPIPAALTLPVCAPTEFSFDGTTYYDQTYCQTPTAPGAGVLPQQELCTANKAYNNDIVNPDGSVAPIMTTGNVPGTQIVETWVGDADFHYRGG